MATSESITETVTASTNRVTRRLVSREEAAVALGIGLTKFKALVAAGAIDHVAIGRRILIPVAALDAYVDRLRAEQDGNGNGNGRRTKPARKAPQTRRRRSGSDA